MKKQINIRCVYAVEHQVMNVGEDGTKTHYDPVTGIRYIYGSSENVKRNIKDAFKDISGISSPKTVFEKKFDPKNIKDDGSVSEKQGGVSTEIDCSNPFCSTFGAWNASEETYKEKYAKAAIKSAIELSDFTPLHTLFSYKTSDCIVNVGDENSSIAAVFEKGKETLKFTSAEELAKGANVTLEMANAFFNNTRKMNFVKANETTNGIYKLDICINVEELGRYNLTDNPGLVTEEEKQALIEKGMILKKVNNKEYLYYPTEFTKDILKWLVYSIFNWGFSSNNSLHGAKPELLRIAITDKNVSLWHQSTFAYMSKDGESIIDKKADFSFIDGLEEKGVYTYNTLLLKKYMLTDNVSIDALDNAMEKVVELGNKMIDEK